LHSCLRRCTLEPTIVGVYPEIVDLASFKCHALLFDRSGPDRVES
jgi:hypothetical protein